MKKYAHWILPALLLAALVIPYPATADKIGVLLRDSNSTELGYAYELIVPYGSTITGGVGTLNVSGAGLFATLTDPNAHSIAGWNDSTNAATWFTIGSGLSFDNATNILSVTGSGDAAADGATKGIATFLAADFNSSSGLISIDYANGQAATGSVPGFLSAADWTTFNGKQATITRPVSGPASATTGNLAVFGANNQTLADYGSAPFDPAVPGAIGGTTPAAGTFTKVEVSGGAIPTTGMSKDGSNNLTLCDAVVGTCKTLTQLVTGVAGLSNLPLGVRQIPGSIDGLTVQALNFDKKGVWAGDNNTVPSELAVMDRMVENIGASFDGGGAAIAANKVAYRMIDYNATITGWTVLCDQNVGDSAIDFYIYKDAYSANTLPTTDIVSTGARPTVAAGTNKTGQGSTFTDWTTTTITAGDMMGFKVKTAPTAAQWCNLSLKVKRR